MTIPELRSMAARAAAPDRLAPPEPSLGLRWRPLGPGDTSTLAELVGAIETAADRPYRTSRPEIADWFVGSWKDHARDTLAGYDADGILRAFAQVTTAPGDERVVRAFLSGGVHPEWRGRGVGRALVTWMVGRARQLLAVSGKELPGRLLVHTELTSPAAQALYSAAGFTPIRRYSDMRRSLSEPLPDVKFDAGLRIVPWTPDLDEPARLAHNETFRDHWGSEPRTPESWLANHGSFARDWSFVALDEASGEVAGYLMSSRHDEGWAAVGHSTGYTDLLGVRRPWRGRRLGAALLATAMGAYRADGIDFAELDVDTENITGAHHLYERLGYQTFHGVVAMAVDV